MEILEWWPDYGQSPLWRAKGRGGVAVDISILGLGSDLEARVTSWADVYSDDKLPVDQAGDAVWIQAGMALLSEVRAALAGRYEVVVTEPWWGNPTDL